MILPEFCRLMMEYLISFVQGDVRMVKLILNRISQVVVRCKIWVKSLRGLDVRSREKCQKEWSYQSRENCQKVLNAMTGEVSRE